MASQLQMQPTFQVELPVELEEAKARIREAIHSDELSAHATSAGTVIDYRIESSEQRFWSPHLSVQLHHLDPASKTEAFCRFSPRPEIWTMVMAVYAVASFCFLGSLLFGMVQWMMHDPPWAWVVAPPAILAIAGLHLASIVGQNWSKDQMAVLRSRWERTLELAFADDRS